MRYVLLALALIFIIIWGAWLFAVPADLIKSKAEAGIRAEGLDAEMAGFEKGWFYNVHSEALHIRSKGATLLSISAFKARLDFSALLSMRAGVKFNGIIGGGRLSGSIARGIFKDKAPALDAELKDAKLDEMNLYALTGQSASGTLDAKVGLKAGSGEITFNVPDLRSEELNIKGIRLPFEVSGRLMGRLSLKSKTIELHSVSFEGGGLFARATGTINASGNNVKIELMPEGDRFKDPALAAFMSGFKVSKGRYVVPVSR